MRRLFENQTIPRPTIDQPIPGTFLCARRAAPCPNLLRSLAADLATQGPRPARPTRGLASRLPPGSGCILRDEYTFPPPHRCARQATVPAGALETLAGHHAMRGNGGDPTG